MHVSCARLIPPLVFLPLMCATAHALTEPVRLELRIVPQSGALPGLITDAVAPAPITAANQPARFELQYRILDLISTDSIVPAGLGIGLLNIRLTDASGNTGAFDRAPLSRYEAQLAAAAPPSSPDSSGGPLTPLTGAAGLHRPFRGGIPAPPPNNSTTANGELLPLGITRITPVSLAPSDQGNANAGQDNLAWYGLYSFTWAWTGGSGTGQITISAEFAADSTTGNRFSFWNDGANIPISSSSASAASITIPLAIALPGACCTAGPSCTVLDAPTCAATFGAFAGPGIVCTPTL